MEKKEQLYEGKAKKVYATDDPALCIVSYKDDATAFNGLKKGTIAGKGVVNNRMTNMMMQLLEKRGVPTHFVKELSDRDTLVKKVKIVPLEVIIRNVSAGSFAKRYGVEEGIPFDEPTIEFSYKNDELGDPLLNTYHALALKLATKEEITLIETYAFRVNEVLKEYFLALGVKLIDFKLEFGKLPDGTIVLAVEISPASRTRTERSSSGSPRATESIRKRKICHRSMKNAACSASFRKRCRMSQTPATTPCSRSSTAGRNRRASSSTATACSRHIRTRGL